MGYLIFDWLLFGVEVFYVNLLYLIVVVNDYDYDIVFVRVFEGFVCFGDMFFVISIFGNFMSVLWVVKIVRELGVMVVVMMGEFGG